MKFLIREAQEYEIPRILQFYSDNPDRHVMPRPEAILKSATEDGYLFLIEDLSGRTAKYAGVSGVYAGRYGGKIFMEAGGSRIASQYQGFGLHRYCHFVRSITAYHNEADLEGYFGGIICPNHPSVINIQRCGFVPWHNPPSDLVEERKPFAGDDESIEYFTLPTNELRNHARRIIEIEENGYFEKSGQKVRLTIDIALNGVFRDSLESMADGPPSI